MKLHSDTLTGNDILLALKTAQAEGNVTADVSFVVFGQAGSRQRRHAWEIQLGTFDGKSTGKSRHAKTNVRSDAGTCYSATYDEWGYFLREIFLADPDAIFGQYKELDNFDEQTKYAY